MRKTLGFPDARSFAAALSLLGLAACTDTREAFTGTQSLSIELVTPATTGSPDEPLDDNQRTIVVNITALDENGDVDTSFDKDVQVYAQFLGTLTPTFGSIPLATLHLTAGSATNQTFDLPNAFGPTVVWIDDGQGVGPDYVHGAITGTSPTLFYREPFVVDLQKPRDEASLDALSVTPLQDKQVGVNRSHFGARGRLVVNSVFAQGYTVSDLNCANDAGDPPCVGEPFGHVMVFSFSAPRDECFGDLQVGQTITGFAGGLSEFNGLTEIGFPQTFSPKDANGDCIRDINPARLPAPETLDPDTWFKALGDPDGMINFERNEAAPIQILNGKVCDLDEDFDTFKQWKVDPKGVGGDCSRNDDVLNVISTGITTIDPPSLVGKTLSKVVGVVRPVSIGSFNVWIIFPRDAADIVQ
jgi:hypothetical protein